MATRALRKDAGQARAPFHNHVFRDFAGVNTQPKRQAIGPNQFAKLTNVMPIGHGNGVVLPEVSAAIATIPNGIVYNMKSVNLLGTNYQCCVTTTGHAYLVDLDNTGNPVFEISDVSNPQFSSHDVFFAQWENTGIAFIDPVNGYFFWDANQVLMLRNGLVTGVTITDGGAYTSVPTVTFTGGGGAGAAADAVMGINGGQEINTAGTGYTVGDILTMVGGTFTNAGKLKVISVGGGGDVTEVAVFDPGAYTALPTPAVAVTGGTGTGFDFNPVYAVFSVNITNPGTVPYNDPPAVSFSASGLIGLEGDQTINAAGTGYVPGEILTFVGGTFTTAAQLTVTVTVGGGVNQVAIRERGVYSVVPANPVSTTGGGADDCTIDANWASDLAAAGTAVLVTGPESGQAIEVFANRVWIGQDRTLVWSAPDSPTDFVSTGAGQKVLADPTLHSKIFSLNSANNFLYVTGVDSVDVIGDVVVNSLGDTVFSQTNLVANIGTQRVATIISYYRAMLFLNPSGIYAVYGSTPVKISDDLDGIFKNFDESGQYSAGVVMLNNILCAAFNIIDRDDLTGSNCGLSIFFNKKWFFATQAAPITIIASGVSKAMTRLYGTDGTNIYLLFEDTESIPPWEVKTAFWDMNDVTLGKQLLGFGFEFDTESSGTITVSLDSLSNRPPFTASEDYTVTPLNVVEWINDSGDVVDWINDAGSLVQWAGTGYIMVMQDLGEGGGDQDIVSVQGKYVGMTLASTDVTGTISSLMLKYEYRESW